MFLSFLKIKVEKSALCMAWESIGFVNCVFGR